MNGLGLAWRLARRELRAGARGFRVFIACLALGVAAIAGVGSLSEGVVAGLDAESRTLLGGDVDLRLHDRPASAEQDAYLESHSRALSRVVEMRAMASPLGRRGGRALVELKAVDARYPLVGALALAPSLALDRVLRRADGAWGAAVERGLLVKLGVSLGDRVRVGEATFVIRAIVEHEPDRIANVFRLGPRFLIAAEALSATGLVQPGSLIHYRYRVLLEGGAKAGPWIENLKAAFPRAGWRIRGTEQAAPGVRRFIERMTLFLSFAGLTAILVGGIGVGNAVASHVERKSTTIATLKCLGASGALVFRIYFLQVLALSGLGIALGLVLGAAGPALALSLLAGHLPVRPVVALYPWPLALAFLFGLLTAATFATWPLARARLVPAAGLFRGVVAPVAQRPPAFHLAAVAAGIVALAALTLLGASDRIFAAWFVAGAGATLLALRGGAALVMAVARRLPRPRSAGLRLALTNLYRPGAATLPVVVSLGLGLSVLVAVVLIEGNLSAQVRERLPEEAPAFFFIDIQPDQVDAFRRTVTAVPGTSGFRAVPSLRGRIVRINGVPVEKAEIAPEAEWAVRGDRALTYAIERPADARIVAGRWWPPDYKGGPIISFDADLARGFGVGVGDTLTLNVLGREIEARIASLREIDWRSLRFDFAIIFAPGALEGAPETHIAAVKAPRSAEDMVERAVADNFANISAIRVRDVIEAAARILAGIGWAVRGTAAITVLAGALVLAGAVAAGQRRRVYDAVVFKVLGATRARILAAFVMEYGALGLATGLIAGAIGTATAWAVVAKLMDLEWVFLPGVVAGTVAVCVALTVVFGFAATWVALGQSALPRLRNE